LLVFFADFSSPLEPVLSPPPALDVENCLVLSTRDRGAGRPPGEEIDPLFPEFDEFCEFERKRDWVLVNGPAIQFKLEFVTRVLFQSYDFGEEYSVLLESERVGRRW